MPPEVVARNAHAYRFALLGGLSFGYDVALVGGILPTLERTLALERRRRAASSSRAPSSAARSGAFVGAALMRSARTGAIGVGDDAGVLGVRGARRRGRARRRADATGLALGRVALGVGVGGVAVIAPAYCGETSAVETREGAWGRASS